jgi:hypothetical protein
MFYSLVLVMLALPWGIKKPRPARAGGVESLELDSSPLRRAAAYAYYYTYDYCYQQGGRNGAHGIEADRVHGKIAKQK